MCTLCPAAKRPAVQVRQACHRSHRLSRTRSLRPRNVRFASCPSKFPYSGCFAATVSLVFRNEFLAIRAESILGSDESPTRLLPLPVVGDDTMTFRPELAIRIVLKRYN